jgi:hypothetical protein
MNTDPDSPRMNTDKHGFSSVFSCVIPWLPSSVLFRGYSPVDEAALLRQPLRDLRDHGLGLSTPRVNTDPDSPRMNTDKHGFSSVFSCVIPWLTSSVLFRGSLAGLAVLLTAYLATRA